MATRLRRPSVGRWAGVGVVALLGLAVLTLPYDGDQALFDVGARELIHGGVYYGDFWDIKQPGIYWFYELAARVFGSGPVGAHLLDLAWMTATAVVITIAAARFSSRPWLVAAAPVLGLAPYYLRGDPLWLGQIEELVNLPLLLVLLLGLRAANDPRWGRLLLLAAGVASAAVLVLKVLFAPVVLVLWAVVLHRHHRPPPQTAGPRPSVVALGWLLLGAALPVLAVVASFAAHGVLGNAWRTTVVLPGQVAALPGLHSGFLAVAKAILSTWTLTGSLAVVGVLIGGWRGWEPATGGLVGWVLVMTAVSLPEYPTSYRPLAVLVPLGLLAVRGADRLAGWAADQAPSRRPLLQRTVWLSAAALVLALPLLEHGGRLAAALAHHRVGLGAQRGPLAAAVSPGYRDVAAEVARLPALPPGDDPIFVLGHPLYYQLLGRTQAIELHGWGPEQETPALWTEMTRELRRSHPAVVAIDAFSLPYVRAHGAGILALLHEDYRVLAPDVGGARGGTWWVTDHPGRGAPGAGGLRL